VAAWNEAVRLSMVVHRERVRALSVSAVWHSFRALGCSDRGPSPAPLAKLRRRGSVGMKRKGKCDSTRDLRFLDEFEQDRWMEHIGESMESESSFLLTQRSTSTPTSILEFINTAYVISSISLSIFLCLCNHYHSTLPPVYKVVSLINMNNCSFASYPLKLCLLFIR